MISRQVARRALVKQSFERMTSTQPHRTRNRIGFDASGRGIYTPFVETPLRAERRKVARAVAAGLWRNRSVFSIAESRASGPVTRQRLSLRSRTHRGIQRVNQSEKLTSDRSSTK